MKVLNEKQIECVAGGVQYSCYCDGFPLQYATFGTNGCYMYCCWNLNAMSWKSVNIDDFMDSNDGLCIDIISGMSSLKIS